MESNMIVVKIKTLDNSLHEIKISREASIENLKGEILSVNEFFFLPLSKANFISETEYSSRQAKIDLSGKIIDES